MFLLNCFLAFFLSLSPATNDQQVKLIFSIDQGFGNGIVVNNDRQAMRHIARELKTLEGEYKVYALFEPQVANQRYLVNMLDICVAHKLPFVFDVVSSDAMTLGTSTEHNQPADGPHGVAISVSDLARYKKKYGRYLAGMRMMELFSQDFTVRAVRTTNPEWKGKGWVMPEDEFFQADILRLYLRFACEHNMFVQFSDWHWLRFAPWDKAQKPNEEALHNLLQEFPDLVTVTYANNEPSEDSVPRIKTWHEAVQPLVNKGAAGFGLSNQSWLRKDDTKCPPEDILAWTRRALELDCKFIQFEPAWYFFNLPRGTFGRSDYTSSPKWKNRGQATKAFKLLRQTLMQIQHTQPAEK